MSDVVFGEKYELLDKPKYRYVPEAIEASNVRISTVVQADELGRWKVDRRLFPRAILARNTFIRFVGRLLHRRMNVAPMKRDDIFTYLLDAKDEETDKGFTTAEIGAEATTLIVAGKKPP
jgi:cytochrome P450